MKIKYQWMLHWWKTQPDGEKKTFISSDEKYSRSVKRLKSDVNA